MGKNIDRGRVLPAILFGSLIIVGVFTIYIGTQLPSDNTQPKELLAQNTTVSTTPKPTSTPEIVMKHYDSKTLNISFDYPANMKILDENYKSLSVGTSQPKIVLSKLEDVYISKESFCSISKKIECIYDSYGEQKDPFVQLELGGEKAKSFYFRDKNKQNWHVVSLSVYKEFQVKMQINSDEEDAVFRKLISSFTFN